MLSAFHLESFGARGGGSSGFGVAVKTWLFSLGVYDILTEEALSMWYN